MRLPRVLLCLFGLAFASGTTWAQETATMLGTVTDPAGAVIPNATVTITNASTGASRNLTTNGSGSYNAPQLQIGSYMLTIESPGFKKYERKDIVLNVNATLREDAALQIGQAQESVTVEANAIQVQSDTNEQSNVITGTQIQNLDTNGRNPVQLATLVPGAASTVSDFNAPTALASNNSISFNGQRPEHNIWRIDGGEAYDRGSGGGMIVNPSPDALAEFRVMTSNYSAQFGAASGGTISMAIKSGTKDFTGSAWEFNRNDAFDAKDFFANRNGTAKPELRYNAYGFNIGGPVFIPHLYNRQKEKTFFFYNMEWRKLIQGNQITVTALPGPEFNGDFGGLTSPIKVPTTTDPAALARFAAAGLKPGDTFQGNKIPASLLDPNALVFLNTNALPKANTPDGRYSQAAPVPTNLREEIVRVDHRFSDKLALMGHLIWDSSAQSYATSLWTGDTYPTVGTLLSAPSYSTVINLTYSISPTVVNEISYNFNGNKLHLTPTGNYQRPAGFNVPEYFPANNLNRLPVINLGSPYSVNYDTGSWPWNNVYGANGVNDNLSVSKGNHNLQFGGSYLRSYKQQDIFGNTNGNFSFDGSATGNSFADFLLGYAHSYSEVALQDAVNIRFNQFAFYAIDNWRVNNRLTLNLGLRWEGIPHAYDANGRLSNFYPGLYNPANQPRFNSDGSLDQTGPGFTTVPGIALSSTPFYLNGVGLAGKNGIPNGLVNNHWNNWGPRVGFAYDVFGNQKTIVRGGVGLFYERIQGNDVYNMGPNPPFSIDPSANNVYFSNPRQSDQTGKSATQPFFPSNFTALNGNGYKNPTAAQFSFGIQHQLFEAAVLNVSYVGSADYHQPEQLNINTLPLNSPERLAVCGGNCISGATNQDPNPFRIYPGFGNITVTQAASNSNYNSLQISLNWRNAHGLSLQGAYTYSHEIDSVSGDLTGISNPFDRNYDRASGNYDRRHIAVFSYVYDLPFFAHSKGLLRTAVGGWTVSGITMVETGTPLTPFAGKDNLGLGGGTTSRPDVTGSLTYPRNVDQWFNTAIYATPAPLQFGSAGRNSIAGPGRANWNVALFKSFALPIRERSRFEFRVETYNTFNHTQFHDVNTTLTDGNFGKVTDTYDPRVLQLGAKLIF